MSRYPLDEDNAKEGWIRGYGVLRMSPWHFAGLFPTVAEANRQRETLGPEYIVKLGSRRLGTDDFIFAEGSGEGAS